MWRSWLSQNFTEVRFLIHPRSTGSEGLRLFCKEELSELNVLNVGVPFEVVEGQDQRARLVMLDTEPFLHAYDVENDSPDLIALKMQFATEKAEKKRLSRLAQDEALEREDPDKYDEMIEKREKRVLQQNLRGWAKDSAFLLNKYGPKDRPSKARINLAKYKPQSHLDGNPHADFQEWLAMQKKKQ
jgi:hypothetical protein